MLVVEAVALHAVLNGVVWLTPVSTIALAYRVADVLREILTVADPTLGFTKYHISVYDASNVWRTPASFVSATPPYVTEVADTPPWPVAIVTSSTWLEPLVTVCEKLALAAAELDW
tara:strand:+ start:364 stop:711 length:348 start_codon:yes stop_codon:yes gene_type:complete